MTGYGQEPWLLLHLPGRSDIIDQAGNCLHSPQSCGLEQPNADDYDDQSIQNRIDAGRHGDIPVNQVQRLSNKDQRSDGAKQKHVLLLKGNHIGQFVIQSLLG